MLKLHPSKVISLFIEQNNRNFSRFMSIIPIILVGK